MTGRYILDIETNGLLPDLTTIHSLVLRDLDTGELAGSYHGESIPAGIAEAAEADFLVGHNILAFDLPAIHKVEPHFDPRGEVRDTLLMSRLVWPDIRQDDFKLRKRRPSFPGQMVGRYSLEAWGHRLGCYKGDYSKAMKEKGLDPWASWNPDMQAYCEQDTETTLALWRLLQRKNVSEDAVEREHLFQRLMILQEHYGVPFDTAAAGRLYAQLAGEREAIGQKLIEAFGEWWDGTEVEPATTRSVKRPEFGFRTVTLVSEKTGRPLKPRTVPITEDYTEGCAYSRIKRVQFSPSNRNHIANRLTTLYGWKPAAFGSDGRPTVDDKVISALPYPEAPLLTKYLTLSKRIGTLAEGKEALIVNEKGGRIHGNVVTIGTVTSRCAHRNPNVNLPKVKTRKLPDGGHEFVLGMDGGFGYEFRSLFTAEREGDLVVMVGADASGLELRSLGHYIARYDGGAYVKLLLEDDIHSVHARALGLDPQGVYEINGRKLNGRDIAKTFIYAFLYGAGDAKLGSIIGKGAKAGKELRAKFLANLPALAALIRDVKASAIQRGGYLLGLDGRAIPVRSPHSALNTLLQSCGAILVKEATVGDWLAKERDGLVFGVDYANVLHVHDEIQQLTRRDLAEEIGQRAVAAIVAAGERFNFRCPLAGEFKIGTTWAETH